VKSLKYLSLLYFLPEDQNTQAPTFVVGDLWLKEMHFCALALKYKLVVMKNHCQSKKN
jgi:hypothetical protein